MHNFLILLTGALTFFLAQTTAVASNRADTLLAVNDTIDVIPGIPATVDLLANDSVPAGDSLILLIYDPYCSYTTGSDGVTFVFHAWGYTGYQVSNYRIMDYKSGVFSNYAKLVFRVHDHSYDYLDVNNVRARINASGLQFFSDPLPGYEIPKGSGISSIFSNSLWIGGVDTSGMLHFAGEQYGQGNSGDQLSRRDFWAGPVSDSAAYSPVQDTLWNHVWKVSKTEIDYHRAHFWEQGYVPAAGILNWPGNGNISLGQAARLAPFSDRNGNGIYEPSDGDYPEIRGDQALFFIYNDDHSAHKESQGQKLRIEVQGMAYAFDRPADTAFKNNTFLHLKVINRSQKTYRQTYFGVWADIDIGVYSDDFTGCDPHRSMFYICNGDSLDGNVDSMGYGRNPPAQAVVILGGPRMDPDGYDNPSFEGDGIAGPSFHGNCDAVSLDSTILSMTYGTGGIYQGPFMVSAGAINGVNFGDGIPDNERFGMTHYMSVGMLPPGFPSYGDPFPDVDVDYYKVMEAHWPDNSHVIYGGNGYSNAGGYGPACSFMFPGLTDTCRWGTNGLPLNGPAEWTEKTAGNHPADRKGAASSGPFTFRPGDVQEMDIAFAWARDYHHFDSTLSKLNAVVDTIRKHFIENRAPGGGPFYGTAEHTTGSKERLKVYPNPANNLLYAECPMITSGEVELSLWSAQGVRILTKVTGRQAVYQIDVSSIRAGFYLLQVRSGNINCMAKVLIRN